MNWELIGGFAAFLVFWYGLAIFFKSQGFFSEERELLKKEREKSNKINIPVKSLPSKGKYYPKDFPKNIELEIENDEKSL